MKQSEAQIQLKQDATNTPNIARLRPAQFQNDFGRSVMSSGHNGRVMFPIERSRAEIDHAYVRVLDHALVTFLFRVVNDFVVRIHKQNILRFQVRVCQFVFMQN